VMVNAGRAGPAWLSDFGSRMGAARLGQATQGAVSVTMRRSLTCADEQFYAQAGQVIDLPARRMDRPGREFLEWHLGEVFQAS
jgi:hypothetical protein